MAFIDSQQRYLTAAQGFLELSMPLDADAELDQIDPFARHLPEVLGLRVVIYRMLGKWELMNAVAKRMAVNVVQQQRKELGVGARPPQVHLVVGDIDSHG